MSSRQVRPRCYARRKDLGEGCMAIPRINGYESILSGDPFRFPDIGCAVKPRKHHTEDGRQVASAAKIDVLAVDTRDVHAGYRDDVAPGKKALHQTLGPRRTNPKLTKIRFRCNEGNGRPFAHAVLP